MTDLRHVSLRRAEQGDAVAVWTWRQDADTRAASFSGGEIAPEEHLAWFAEALVDDDRRLYIVEQAGIPAGLVRFDARGDGAWEMSVNLAVSARGRGLGAVAISTGVALLARENVSATRVVARARPTNAASVQAFQRAGFHVTAADGHAVELTWQRP